MNLKQSVLSLQGNNTPTLQCALPACLENNLLSKALGVSTLYLNNTNIPVFIPELATSATTSYSPGATSSNTQIGASSTSNALDYFVVCRDSANANACQSIVNWTPMNPNAMTPPMFRPDENSIFTAPYYYCFDFMKFLDVVRNAIYLAIRDITGTNETVVLIYEADSDTFNFAIPQALQATQLTIEFSQKLLDLFPFSSTKTQYGTYSINWSTINVTVNGMTMVNTTAPLYDTVFPFDLVLLHTNLPLVQIEFIQNTISAYPLSKPIVFMFRKANAGLSIYNSFVASNDYLFDKVHQFTQDTPKENQLSITLVLRTRKNLNYIEWPIPSNCMLDLLLNTYRIA